MGRSGSSRLRPPGPQRTWPGSPRMSPALPRARQIDDRPGVSAGKGTRRRRSRGRADTARPGIARKSRAEPSALLTIVLLLVRGGRINKAGNESPHPGANRRQAAGSDYGGTGVPTMSRNSGRFGFDGDVTGFVGTRVLALLITVATLGFGF